MFIFIKSRELAKTVYVPSQVAPVVEKGLCYVQNNNNVVDRAIAMTGITDQPTVGPPGYMGRVHTVRDQNHNTTSGGRDVRCDMRAATS